MAYGDRERWEAAARKRCATHYVIVADDSSFIYYAVDVSEDQKLSDVLAALRRRQKIRIVEVVPIPWPESPKPEAGRILYVGTNDWHTGGQATIKRAIPQISGGKPSWSVLFHEVSGEFNYDALMEKQESLSKDYAGRWAEDD